MRTGLFERTRPANVALFVKPCLEFHQHRHLFAGLCGSEQRFDHRRITAYAVQRLFDREYLRVMSGSQQECLHRGERIVRMVQEDIPPADALEDVAGSLHTTQRFGDGSSVRRKFEVRAVSGLENLRQAAHAEDAAVLVNVSSAGCQVFDQQLANAFRQRAVDGDLYHGA